MSIWTLFNHQNRNN